MILRKAAATLGLVILFFSAAPVASASMPSTVEGKNPTHVGVYFFERYDCKFCRAENEFLRELLDERDDFTVISYDVIGSASARETFAAFTEALDLGRITPVTMVGTKVIQGWNGAETTGARLIQAIDNYKGQYGYTPEDIIENPTLAAQVKEGEGCVEGEDGTLGECAVGDFTFTLPFLGTVNLQTFSLTSLSIILGFVDGFNPCAMWVLVTFLLILIQIGDRRRMWQVAGLFILAEAIMYNLILNVWHSAWDFVGLDQIVTPLVGVVALGGGCFFLYRWWKTRKQALTCDITDASQQMKIETKLQNIAKTPLTLLGALGIIGIAFSVNVIEFACSIGIPQAYTKILELNQLGTIGTQWQILIYTLFYMLDDLIVFGLALWGAKKLHLAGKYSNYSALVGGILMLVLGALLLLAPNALVFGA